MKIIMPNSLQVNKVVIDRKNSVPNNPKVINPQEALQSNEAVSKVDIQKEQAIDPTQMKTTNMSNYEKETVTTNLLDVKDKKETNNVQTSNHISEYQKQRLLNTYKIMSRVRDIHEHESLVNDLMQ